MTRARFQLDGETFEAIITPGKDGLLEVAIDGQSVSVRISGDGNERSARVGDREFRVQRHGTRIVVDGAAVDLRLDSVARGQRGAKGADQAVSRIRPPMTGRLEAVRVARGQAVAKGDVLFVLEAMKMHNEVRSPVSGTVTAIHLQPGRAVETGDVVLEIGPAGP
jgi:biotin carboxyl carrier protein